MADEIDKLKEEIVTNPDNILKNNAKLKKVVQNPELAVELVKQKGEQHMDVDIDGKTVTITTPGVNKEEVGSKLINPLFNGISNP